MTLFHEGDLEAYIFRRDHPDEAPKLPDNLVAVRGRGIVDRQALVAEYLTNAGYPAMAEILLAPKPWLTIDQAADISGLPASTVKKLVDSGSLPAID